MGDVGGRDTYDDWDQIGFIISSKYRIAVFQELTDDPSTPTTIATSAELQITHISRALRALTERSLVELLVDRETRKGRVYRITERGRRLWRRIQIAGILD